MGANLVLFVFVVLERAIPLQMQMRGQRVRWHVSRVMNVMRCSGGLAKHLPAGRSRT
jgi:hypothetical protein